MSVQLAYSWPSSLMAKLQLQTSISRTDVSESDGRGAGPVRLFCSIGVLNTTRFGLDADPSFLNIPFGLLSFNRVGGVAKLT